MLLCHVKLVLFSCVTLNDSFLFRDPIISAPVFLPDQSHQATQQLLTLNLKTLEHQTSTPHPNPAHPSPTRPNSEMASGTLPFGGGLPEVSGIATSRSNVTDASQIAEELRDVVRGELRKLIEVSEWNELKNCCTR